MVKKPDHCLLPDHRPRPTGLCIHARREPEQLAFEVVEGEGLVIEGPPALGEGVLIMEQRAAHAPARGKTSGDTDGTDGVETVSVLEHRGFQAARSSSGGEAVLGDGQSDRLGVVLETKRAADHGELDRGPVSTRGRVRVVLRQIDQVMKPRGGEADRDVRAFLDGQQHRVTGDPLDVPEIMGTVPDHCLKGKPPSDLALERVMQRAFVHQRAQTSL